MKIKKLVSVFMMGVMVASNTPVNAFADDVRSASEVMGEDVTTSGSPIAVSDNSVSIDFNVTGKWNNGFNGEITVNNLTEKVIENWQIELSFPQEITNIWNAQIVSYEDGVYNIKNAGGNNNVNISAGGSVTFGFSGTYTDEIIAPTNVKLITDKQNAAEEEYSIEYQLMSDWGSGFNAQIVITNNSDKPIEAWSLEFEFDREIENIWNAVVEEHNNHKYYITNAEYNSVIPSGGSVSFGFNGEGGNKDCEPQNYVLKRTENISSGLPDTEFVNVKTTNSDYYLTEIGYAKGDYANSVTQNLTLPTVGEYNGSTIVWSSSNENIVSSEGVVTRPKGESRYVTLTATFTDEDGSTIQKDYIVKVIKKFVEKELIVCDFNNLAAINDGEMPFIWIEENTGRIKFMRGKYTDYKVESPQEAIYSLNALKKLYGFKNPEEEYVFLMDYDLENVMRIRLQQVYKGITVRGSHLVITTDKEGNIMSITGTYDDIGDLSVTPVSTAKDLSKAIGTDLSEKKRKAFCIR